MRRVSHQAEVGGRSSGLVGQSWGTIPGAVAAVIKRQATCTPCCRRSTARPDAEDLSRWPKAAGTYCCRSCVSPATESVFLVQSDERLIVQGVFQILNVPEDHEPRPALLRTFADPDAVTAQADGLETAYVRDFECVAAMSLQGR